MVSTKVHSLLKREFEISDATHQFWTDISVVLGYIINDSKGFHVFDGNRVQQIRDHSLPFQWRYVSSKENPTDIASRGATAYGLIAPNWLTGPRFLWQTELPQSNDCVDVECLMDDPGVKKAHVFSVSQVETKSVLDRVEAYLVWENAKRAIANCFRFNNLLMYRVDKKIDSSHKFSVLTVNDLQKAEIAILCMVHETHFGKEIEKLIRKTTVGVESSLHRLDPILDDKEVIRVGDRLRQSLDSVDLHIRLFYQENVM